MQELQRGIIDLVGACLTKGKAKIGPDFNWYAAYEIGRKHDIIPMIFYGAAESGIQIPEDVRREFRLVTIQCIMLDRNQQAEIEKIEKSFEERGIDYLPIKGVAMKPRYPRSEVRTMGDADILIREEQYTDIREVMNELGFIENNANSMGTPSLFEDKEGDHAFVWDKPGLLHLELHRRLMPSENINYYSYFCNAWKLSEKAEGNRYIMRPENEFVYLFVHYAKHYQASGVGIRQIVDLFVHIQTSPNLNFQYIETELGKIGLYTFYKNTRETIKVWFEHAEDTEMTDYLTDRIFKNGTFGTSDTQILSRTVKDTVNEKPELVKWHKRIQLIFPSAKALSKNYPILKRFKLLLPFVWVHRWMKVLLFKRGNIQRNFDRIDSLTAENIRRYQAELKYVGLNLNYDIKE